MGSAAAQAELWGAKAEDWAEVQEGQVEPLYVEVIERFVRPGTRVLDVGSGAGRFLWLARARGATVTGMDGTAALLAIARRRVPEARLEEGDIEALPFDDASFDVVTGFNAFPFARDPLKALSEARRVARPGARVVVATWGRPEDCEAATHLLALKPLLPPAPPPAPNAGPGGPFALSDERVLRALVEMAGLRPLDVRDVSCPWIYPDLAAALRGLSSSGPSVLAARTSGDDRVRAAIIEGIAPYRTVAGGYRIENKFRYVVAER
jgi:SAM-dependent methyltransferase